MRTGRLRVYARGNLAEPRVFVRPDDGSEPIELRVSEVFVRGRVGEAIVATVRVFLHSLDIEDVEGRVVRAEPGATPVVYPMIEAHDADGSRGDIEAFGWRFRAGGSLPRLRLRRVLSRTKEAA